MPTTPPERPKRKHIPLAVQLEAALRQLGDFLGCAWNEMDLDHDPALELRPVENGVHVPHQHDARHLYWKPRPDHKLKTNGRRGESDLSLDSNSDKARIAKAKRLERARAALLSVERQPRGCKLLTPAEFNTELKQIIDESFAEVDRRERKKPKHQWAKGRKIESRGFPKRTK